MDTNTNDALREKLKSGWALLTEDDACWTAIGPIAPGCGDLGAQIGTFSRESQDATFYRVPMNHATAEHLVCASIGVGGKVAVQS